MIQFEYWLIRLIEEASEVQHISSKVLRFGPGEVLKGQDLSNEERLLVEIRDFNFIADVLNSNFLYSRLQYNAEEKAKRMAKEMKYMEYSIKLGRVVR